MNILLFSGGISEERAVSIRSGEAVASALKAGGHTVTTHDLTSETIPALDYASYDVVFPVLHGKHGEDGQLQQQLDSLSVAYVGSDAESSSLCFDKWRYKQFIAGQNLPTPRGELVDKVSFWNSPLSRQPFVLKPNDGGSSVDTYLHRDPSPVAVETINDLFSRHSEMLLEELIVGIELTVAVLADTALPVIEIIPPQDGEFNYENKYNGKSLELCPPEHIDESTQRQAQDLARRAHQVCGCGDMSRTDFMLRPSGELLILETNTIPGMTDQSLFPKAAQAANISMPLLVNKLVELARQRSIS